MTERINTLYTYIFIGLFIFCIPKIIYSNSLSNHNSVNQNQNNASTPVAVNDTFVLAYGCNNHSVSGNLLDNDIIPTNTTAMVARVTGSQVGIFSSGTNGNFIYQADSVYRGEVQFKYRLYDGINEDKFTEAILFIIIDDDNDCDNVPNFIDIDDDNDGILDLHEGGDSLDFDLDGIPNSCDIDSDNDGIIDFIEWQVEAPAISLHYSDVNADGWFDDFDASLGGNYYEFVDTDLDGFPDFLDLDSDNDGIEDYIEGSDTNHDGSSDYFWQGMDTDHDGLDNTFDIISGWTSYSNPLGSNCPLPDFNNNGIRDWREHDVFENEEIEEIEGIEDSSNLPKTLLVYPNPTKDICTIEVPTDSLGVYQFDIQLFDLNGKLITRSTENNYIFKLNTNSLKSGTYILLIKAPTITHHCKIVKY